MASSAPATALENHYGGFPDQAADQVWQTSDGGFIIVGTGSDPSGSGTNLILVKTDPISNSVWSKNLGGTDGHSVRQTSDGGYIAAGAHGDSIYLVKTDEDGNRQWEKDFTNKSGPSSGYSIQLTSDGGYIIAGQVKDSTGKWELELLKTDGSGNTLWDIYYGMPETDIRIYSVWPTSDGGYIAGGYKKGDASAKPLIVKVDANGNIEWAKSYEGPGAQDNFLSDGFGIQQTLDGGYIYAGEHSSYTYLLKVDAAGDKQWDHDFGMTGANSVQQTWDGGYILAGSYTDTQDITAAYVVRTDANGNKLWDSIYRGLGYAKANSVIQIGSGAFVLAGSTKADKNGNSNVYFVEIGRDTTPAPGAKLVSDTIPARMEAGHTYNVQVTFENDGTMPWTYQDKTTFGHSGDASKFGATGANSTIPIGKVIRPGQSETFAFTMTAPKENGTYNPRFQMMWESHGPFGEHDDKTILVVNTIGQASATATATPKGGLPCLSSMILPLLATCVVAVGFTMRKKKGDR